jgi:glycosyltransferase involved in cell wall biosynthesis
VKILCIIDSLGSGGAQRQIVNLACGLKAKKHEVEFFIYHSHLNFFRSVIDDAGIRVHEVNGISGFSFRVIRSLAKVLRETSFDAIISFLPSTNIYAVLGKLLSGTNCFLIVGERASKSLDSGFFYPFVQRSLYIFAKNVVANSYHQAEYLRKYFWIRNKISTIYNGYKIDKNSIVHEPTFNNSCKFLVVGRIDSGKNGIRLVKALEFFHRRNGYLPQIHWAGRQEQDQKSIVIRDEMDHLITTNSALDAAWCWLGEHPDIPTLLFSYDALIHISLHEGLPNVVCEAFIAGRPVIASAVCDHPLLIEEEVRGLLCDPFSSESICKALERFYLLSLEGRQKMGRNARRFAEDRLTIERMVDQYEALIT